MKGRCLIRRGKLRKQANKFFDYEMNSSDKQNYTSHTSSTFNNTRYLMISKHNKIISSQTGTAVGVLRL